MKKILILSCLIGMYSCTNDSSTDLDTQNNNALGSHGTNNENFLPVKTNTTDPISGYYSPYDNHMNVTNTYGVITQYKNESPFKLELTALAGDLHHQTVVGNFNLYQSVSPIIIPASNNLLSYECGGIFNVLAPFPVACPSPLNGLLTFDFSTIGGDNWFLLHHGKIHAYYYEVYDDLTNTLIDFGYLKQRFMTDGLDAATIESIYPWTILGPVNGLPGIYDAVAMYNNDEDEICIAQGSSSATVLPSSVTIQDPISGDFFELQYYTTDGTASSGGFPIVVSFTKV